jgi:NADH-quinone oxidoreductase subunit G
MTKFFINGKEVVAQKGETILNVARREGIYIPTMCYLEKVFPIASCRLCVVDVKGTNGHVLSCQEKPTEGIEVTTDTPEIFKHRQNIMKFYDVNHPLECGVCDKSGACDLQNKTLEFGINCQDFSAKDQPRKIENWGRIQYDPSLCIMCEKCVSTCNEVIGDDAIELHFGGYSSAIVPKGSDKLECTNCGECIAVCPVGALISTDFKYSSNAWELEKIPAICSHCSAGCELNYEVKHSSSTDNSKKIYRVTNDFETKTLCGAGRFGFDFGNSEIRGTIEEAVSKIKEANSIVFNSQITNEEAKILQALKDKLGLKLYNRDAKNLQEFLEAFAKSSGDSLHNGTLEDIANSNQIVIIGTKISSDNPMVRYKLTEAYKKHRAFISYIHPVYDPILQNTIKQFVNYEVGTEEGVMALIAETLLGNVLKLDLDIGYLSGETNIGEEELAFISKIGKRAKKRTLVIGSDLIAHEKRENIAKFVGIIQRYTDIKIVLVPNETNSLGVATICDLDGDILGKSVGYNTPADYTISALGDGDFSVPALNQQEGTFVNIDKKVVKTNVALNYKGYNLNDIANRILTSEKENTIDYTKEIFGIDFDDLENLTLQNLENDFSVMPDEVEDLPTFDGTTLYNVNPVLQFNPFTAKAIQEEPVLLGSEQFAMAGKVKDGDRVEFEIMGEKMERIFKIDKSLRGVIALNPIFDLGLKSYLLSSNYRFHKAKIVKVEK